MEASKSLTFVYYCSGHGYGHATRVSAFARHLLSLDCRPNVHIVSSAPKHVFSDSITQGALYRNANIDPVIVQPLAYRVDRQKSVEVLEKFIEQKDQKVWEESQWLRAIHADCVLSDAAFLGCLAANEAGIPSVLITNFTFDSVYSYLSTPLLDVPPKPTHPATGDLLSPPSAQTQDDSDLDIPVPSEQLAPLVEQIHAGYRCADLLLQLPGTIPLPSFSTQPALPSPAWVDPTTRSFTPSVLAHLAAPPSTYTLHPQIPFPSPYPQKPLARAVAAAPLLVRPPDPDVYTPAGRARLLTSLGVPAHLHDPATTRVLIVSFGGQVFHRPHSRSHSRTPSKEPQVSAAATGEKAEKEKGEGQGAGLVLNPADAAPQGKPPSPPTPPAPGAAADLDPSAHARALQDALTSRSPDPAPALATDGRRAPLAQLRLHGAPPAAVPTTPRTATAPTFAAPLTSGAAVPAFEVVTIPPTPAPDQGCTFDTGLGLGLGLGAGVEEEAGDSAGAGTDIAEGEGEEEPRILPDASWIAVVCGVPQDWGRADGEALPDGFYVAPRDVYMPDLTAAADVLLGKLGYGTVSECVDACTPFVFVPRPLFVEEHGLRRYLAHEGVGVELSRAQYEAGEWADAVEEAYRRGAAAKARKRAEGETGRRTAEGRDMARTVVDWVQRWQAGVAAERCEQKEAGIKTVLVKEGEAAVALVREVAALTVSSGVTESEAAGPSRGTRIAVVG